jgi:limonene 1,2-monooxygenase
VRFGVFLAPFHANRKNPTLALEHDLELIAHMDRLGFDEAWIGEHHSGGVELIASPEIFIAAAAARTKHIRLGTGVISLSYHHPLNVIERVILLDHLTRGRIMMGVGPGALAIDAYQRGIEPSDQRRRMSESLEAIMALLNSDEPVTIETDWFTIREGSLHLKPYQQPCFEIACASLISPSGPELAGRVGASLLSIGSTLMEDGVEALATFWGVYEESCRKHGNVPNRDAWRVVAPWHLAPTREQALEEVEYGIKEWVDYELDVANLPLVGDAKSPRDAAEKMLEIGAAVIGTPADAIAAIEEMYEKSGGFGTLLNMVCDWAPHDAKMRSFELFANEVIPHFQGRIKDLDASYNWGTSRKGVIGQKVSNAFIEATRQHFGDDHARTRKMEEVLGDPADGTQVSQ